jgi:anti-sigma B factor antagonist
MVLELVEHDGFAVLAAKGRLNMVAAPELRSAVEDAAAAGQRRLVLDLAETDFIDSSGLGALVGCLKTMREAGGELRLANVGQQARMVFELSGVDKVLVSHPSAQEAFGDG